MNRRLYDYNKRCQTGNGYPPEKMYRIKDKEGVYYNIEEYQYLVKAKSKDDCKPVSEPLAKSFVDCDMALKMEEVV